MRNDLAKTNARQLTVSDLAISTPLWRLLSSDLKADIEVGEILSVPALHEEAKAIAPLLARQAAPCGREAVQRALQPLVLVYGVPEAAKASAFWDVYFDVLGELPAEALARAVKAYPGQATAEYFPKPGPLKALAEKYAEPIRKAANRAKRAADSLPRRPRPPADPEAVKQILADVAARLGPKPDSAA